MHNVEIKGNGPLVFHYNLHWTNAENAELRARVSLSSSGWVRFGEVQEVWNNMHRAVIIITILHLMHLNLLASTTPYPSSSCYLPQNNILEHYTLKFEHSICDDYCVLWSAPAVLSW